MRLTKTTLEDLKSLNPSCAELYRLKTNNDHSLKNTHFPSDFDGGEYVLRSALYTAYRLEVGEKTLGVIADLERPAWHDLSFVIFDYSGEINDDLLRAAVNTLING